MRICLDLKLERPLKIQSRVFGLANALNMKWGISTFSTFVKTDFLPTQIDSGENDVGMWRQNNE
jgi:hypothetical protein